MKKFVVVYRYFDEELQDLTFNEFRVFTSYAPALAHAKSQSVRSEWGRVDLDCHELNEGDEFNTLTMHKTIQWSESYKDGKPIPRISLEGQDIMRWDLRSKNLASIEWQDEPETEVAGEQTPDVETEFMPEPERKVVKETPSTPDPEVQEEVVEIGYIKDITEPEPEKIPDTCDVSVGDCFKMENGTMIIKVVAIHKSFTRHEAVWATGTEIGYYSNKSLLTEKVAKMERYDSNLYEEKKAQIMAILNNKIEF